MESFKQNAIEHSIKVAQVSKKFGTDIEALREVSFDLKKGEFLSIVGPSGCGKSTLLRLIAGLILPDSGYISIYGSQVNRTMPSIAMIFQTPALLDWRTVLGNIMLPIEILKLDKRKYADTARVLIQKAGLSGFENRHPYELSGGMQQRVAVCRALISDPKVILADEPFASLDPLMREKMSMELVSIFEQFKRDIIFVTHSIQEAILLSDRVLVMSNRPGRVKASIPIGLPRPRGKSTVASKDFAEYTQKIYELIQEEIWTK